MTYAVVIPNHLPHLDFLKEWGELEDAQLIVVQDGPEAPEAPEGAPPNIRVYTWDDIDADLGAHSWIIPRKTSAVRSYGYLKAYEAGVDVILTLDNDCYPDGSPWIQGHQRNLGAVAALDWVTSTPDIPYTRGFPYRIRDLSPVVLSHGLWSGVPDLDAATSLHMPDLRLDPARGVQVVPRHSFFPVCGMNLAWRREITPALYFGIFGPEYGFDQYDDIWAGVLVKRVLDHLGLAAVTGAPSVEHRKQSDVFANIRKQAPGLEMNENFWIAVRHVPLTATTVLDTYEELIVGLPDVIEGEPKGWTRLFKDAAQVWVGRFR